MQPARISARAVVKVVSIALAVIAVALLVGWIVLQIRTTLRWLFMALFIAIVLGPAVDALAGRRIAGRVRIPRWIAILLVFIGLVALLLGITLIVVPPIIHEIEDVGRKLPGYVHDFEVWAEHNHQFRELNHKYNLTHTVESQASQLPGTIGDAASSVGDLTVTLLENVVAAITILVIAFFILIDGPAQGERLLRVMPSGAARRIRNVARQIYRIVAGYISINLLLAVVAGLFTWLILELIGVELAVPLAVLVVFLDLIPLIGLTIAGILIAIVTAIHSFPEGLIIWLVAFLIFQQLQDRIVQPLLYRNAVKVHPVVAIAALLFGADLLGILGALVAIPVAASIGVVIRELIDVRRTARERRAAAAAAEREAELEGGAGVA